jgi:hypothetical protein
MKAKDLVMQIIKRLRLEKDPLVFYAELIDHMMTNIQRVCPDKRLQVEDACLLALYETQESFINKMENK